MTGHYREQDAEQHAFSGLDRTLTVVAFSASVNGIYSFPNRLHIPQVGSYKKQEFQVTHRMQNQLKEHGAALNIGRNVSEIAGFSRYGIFADLARTAVRRKPLQVVADIRVLIIPYQAVDNFGGYELRRKVIEQADIFFLQCGFDQFFGKELFGQVLYSFGNIFIHGRRLWFRGHTQSWRHSVHRGRHKSFLFSRGQALAENPSSEVVCISCPACRK